jgi:ElaB/YqjD/DUF883 family membrane-anchored ribosome-binding protein
MPETTENGQNTAPSASIICRSEMHMSEIEETAREYGRKIAATASKAHDYLSEKATIAGEKIKDLHGKDFNEIAGEAKDYARKNPGQAILISAAAGLFLGLLLRGARR